MKQEEKIKMYEKIYEKPYHVEWLGKYKGYEVQIKVATKLTKGTRILDIGCGEGVIASRFNGKVIGVDISKNALKYGKENYKKVKFVPASAMNLPFKDDSFDCVTSFELIEHLTHEDMHKCLKEIKRVCSSNGRVVISTPNLSSVYYALFRALGIKNKEHINEMDFIRSLNTLAKYFRIIEIHSNTETPWLRSVLFTKLISRFQKIVLRFFPSLKHLFHSQIYVVMENLEYPN